MVLTVDAEHLGTSERRWRRSGRLRQLRPLEIGRPHRVAVVAPHPDDEVLGAGGLIRRLVLGGADVRIVAVTDGEASHPGTPDGMGARRHGESLTALRRLGAGATMVTSLGIPDGHVGDHLEELLPALEHQLRGADLALAPWRHDGHPDHDACGVATARVTAGTDTRRLDYLVWAWHWSDPWSDDIPWKDCRRLDLDPVTHARKWWSTRAYRSQIRPSRAPAPAPPVLPRAVLARLRRNVEVFVDGGAG